MEVILELRDIVKKYSMGEEEQIILDHVNFSLKKGEFVSILGPSGSGKSTLMNILGCLDVPSSGEYILNSHEVEGLDEKELAQIRNREIGFVFQQFQLLPRLTAVKNVELPLVYAGVPERERRMLASEMLTKVGLEHKLNHYPSQLSGGQQQRVAIARALITKPTLLLADEPTGALDQKTGAQIMELFQELYEEGRTIVMITHDEQIAKHGSRIVRILDGTLSEKESNLEDSIEKQQIEAQEKKTAIVSSEEQQTHSLVEEESVLIKDIMNGKKDSFRQLFQAFFMIMQDEKMSETAGELIKQFGTKLRESKEGGDSDVKR